MPDAKKFTTLNDLSQEIRDQSIDLLNQQLADTSVLYGQIKYAHWNVKGPQFYSLHLLFDSLAEEVEGYVDMIAERATALGGTALGTPRMAVDNTRLKEYPPNVDGMQHVNTLCAQFAALCRSTRRAGAIANSNGDQDTFDLFVEVSRGLDKALWFLEAHVQK